MNSTCGCEVGGGADYIQKHKYPLIPTDLRCKRGCGLYTEKDSIDRMGELFFSFKVGCFGFTHSVIFKKINNPNPD